MKRHYELAPIGPFGEPLVFDWDEEAGTVSGPGAARILEVARGGSVFLHPAPAAHDLGRDPLRSKADMEAIAGYWWRCPDHFASFYPAVEEGPADDSDVEPVY